MLIITYYINYVSDVYTNFLYKLFYKLIQVDAYRSRSLQAFFNTTVLKYLETSQENISVAVWQILKKAL